jgi:hypothetical protein
MRNKPHSYASCAATSYVTKKEEEEENGCHRQTGMPLHGRFSEKQKNNY